MHNKKLLVIFLTVFIDLVGFGIIIPISPYLARQFNADPLEIGVLMALYSGFQFLFSPFWGRLSDRRGRRPIILISLLGVGVAHLLFSFSTSIWMMYISRALAGFFGANISTALAVIADVTESKDRSKSMGLIGAAFGLGFILGPLLGGGFAILGEQFGSQPPFGPSFAAVGAAALSFLNVIFAYFFLQESLPPEKRNQVQRKNRITQIKKYIRQPVVGVLMISFFLTTFAMAHIENQLFLFMQDEYTWDLKTASLGFAYVGVIMVLTQGLIVRKMMPRFGERNVLLLGLLFSAISFAIVPNPDSLWIVGLGVTLMGLGVGLINPAISGSVSVLSPAQEQGEALGVNQSFSALGRVVGPAFGGYFYRDISHQAPFLAASLVTVLALGLCYYIRHDLPMAGKKIKA